VGRENYGTVDTLKQAVAAEDAFKDLLLGNPVRTTEYIVEDGDPGTSIDCTSNCLYCVRIIAQEQSGSI